MCIYIKKITAKFAPIQSEKTKPYAFSWSDIMAAILKVWCQIKNITLSINMYCVENIPPKFHLNPIWYDGVLGIFEDGSSNNKKHNNNNKMSSDLRSVPNLTMMFSLQYITNITESQPKPPST